MAKRPGISNLTTPGLGGKGFIGARQAPTVASGWTARTPYQVGSVYAAVSYAAGTVVLDNNARSAFSTDGGVTWTARAAGQFGSISASGALFEGGNIISAGQNVGLTQVRIITSADNGATWVARTALGSPASIGAVVLATNGAGVMFAGLDAEIAGGSYFTSADSGLTWTQHNTLANVTWANDQTPFRVLWDGTQFVACVVGSVSPFTASIGTSNDGIAWTLHTSPDPGDGNSSIAFGNGVYVLSDNANFSIYTAATIPGLATASPITPPFNGRPDAVVFDGQRFFCFDTAGEVFSSVNGLAWTQEALNFIGADACGVWTYDTKNHNNIAFGSTQLATQGSISTRAQ